MAKISCIITENVLNARFFYYDIRLLFYYTKAQGRFLFSLCYDVVPGMWQTVI